MQIFIDNYVPGMVWGNYFTGRMNTEKRDSNYNIIREKGKITVKIVTVKEQLRWVQWPGLGVGKSLRKAMITDKRKWRHSIKLRYLEC